MNDHPFGWLSLLPPLVAIVLSIATRRVVLALLAGIFFGALVLYDWNPIRATGEMLSTHLLEKLLDRDTLHIFLFTILMGAMVGVVNRAAGMRGLVNAVSPFASTRRRGQFVTWLLGLAVFFDDYANTLLLGNTLRPLTDRLKISREKLAYLVDSTAAPVAGLALLSTWVASEIAFVEAGLEKLPAGFEGRAYELFVASIPYRFYILWALLFVPMVALLGRDFGPMLRAERRSLSEQPDPLAHSETALADSTSPDPQTIARWYNSVVPILVTVIAVVFFLYQSGAQASTDSLMEIIGNADSYSALLRGAFAGLATAFVLIVPQRIVPTRDLMRAAGGGAILMMPALVILWLAQTLSTMTGGGNVDADAIAGRTETAAWMQIAGATNSEIAATLNDRTVPEAIAVLISKDEIAKQLRQDRIGDADAQANEQENEQSRRETAFTAEFLANENVRQNLQAAGFEDQLIGTALAFTEDAPAGSEQTGIDSASAYLMPKFIERQHRLYTGDFLSRQLQRLRDGGGFFSDHFVQFLPTMVFLLAGVVAFSTGTSWGTMGIVMPLVIPLAWSQLTLDAQLPGGEAITAGHPILLASIASVLAGAIFGDHCSPISDTTVLSSQASGCDHAAHVQTQLPYAMLVAVVSIVCGTLPIGFGVSVWLLLPAGVVVMLAFLLLFGKRCSDSE